MGAGIPRDVLNPAGMAQTLGSDVPFVMLTASEVFSLEVSGHRAQSWDW
jgi:DNA helicase TIP49 (TBP-interacting protein)